MKRVLTAVSIASVMAASTAFALSFNAPGATNLPGQGVLKSKHNMNLYTDTTHDDQGRVCAFCHTPHHALSDASGQADYLPLWSHKLTGQTYTPYNSATIGALDLSNPLAGPTMLCMSCHDGVIAVDEHYTNGLTTNKLNDDGFGGTAIGLADGSGQGNLGNDHPVGFLYSDAVQAHPGDLAPDTTKYDIGNGSRSNKMIKDQLTGGVFTCATCHDVHNKDNVANTYTGGTNTPGNYFLLGDNNNSGLCLTCHVK